MKNSIFSYGGELGDVGTFQVEGILNSPQAVQALEDYKRLFSYTPPGWSKAFFVENNQAITEGLAAMSMGDKIGVLSKGRLVQVGTPSQVYDQPCNTFVARAVGSPPINLIDGRVSSGSMALGEGVLSVAAPEGRDLTFGIRPENIRLDGGAPVAGRIFDIEDHGVVKILTLQVADNRIHATVPARTKVALDEVVRFDWLPGKVLVFDRVTGDNLALV